MYPTTSPAPPISVAKPATSALTEPKVRYAPDLESKSTLIPISEFLKLTSAPEDATWITRSVFEGDFSDIDKRNRAICFGWKLYIVTELMSLPLEPTVAIKVSQKSTRVRYWCSYKEGCIINSIDLTPEDHKFALSMVSDKPIPIFEELSTTTSTPRYAVTHGGLPYCLISHVLFHSNIEHVVRVYTLAECKALESESDTVAAMLEYRKLPAGGHAAVATQPISAARLVYHGHTTVRTSKPSKISDSYTFDFDCGHTSVSINAFSMRGAAAFIQQGVSRANIKILDEKQTEDLGWINCSSYGAYVLCDDGSCKPLIYYVLKNVKANAILFVNYDNFYWLTKETPPFIYTGRGEIADISSYEIILPEEISFEINTNLLSVDDQNLFFHIMPELPRDAHYTFHFKIYTGELLEIITLDGWLFRYLGKEYSWHIPGEEIYKQLLIAAITNNPFTITPSCVFIHGHDDVAPAAIQLELYMLASTIVPIEIADWKYVPAKLGESSQAALELDTEKAKLVYEKLHTSPEFKKTLETADCRLEIRDFKDSVKKAVVIHNPEKFIAAFKRFQYVLKPLPLPYRIQGTDLPISSTAIATPLTSSSFTASSSSSTFPRAALAGSVASPSRLFAPAIKPAPAAPALAISHPSHTVGAVV